MHNGKYEEKNYTFNDMEAMFICLFEGETSSKAKLYYNNLQEKISNTSYSYLY
jgi:hypothetical protein